MAKQKRSTPRAEGDDPALSRLLAKRDAVYDQWEENSAEWHRAQEAREKAEDAMPANAAKSTEKGA